MLKDESIIKDWNIISTFLSVSPLNHQSSRSLWRRTRVSAVARCPLSLSLSSLSLSSLSLSLSLSLISLLSLWPMQKNAQRVCGCWRMETSRVWSTLALSGWRGAQHSAWLWWKQCKNSMLTRVLLHTRHVTANILQYVTYSMLPFYAILYTYLDKDLTRCFI